MTALDHRARLAGVDLARALAVVSMIIAHTSPSAIDLPAEYLTAPLFAMLIGVGLALGSPRGPAQREAAAIFTMDTIVRGSILIVLGVLLQRLYPMIDVVLQTLGLTMIVLAPVARALAQRPRAALGFALGFYAISPAVMERSRMLLTEHQVGPELTDLIDWLAAGAHYRVVSDLVFALTGIALAAWLRAGGGRGGAGLLGSLTLASISALVVVTGKVTGWGGLPYAGDHLELLATTALAAAVILGATWLAERVEVTGPLAALLATGRMALSAYAVQILYLALLRWLRGPLVDDNAWWVLVTTIALCIGVSWGWQRYAALPGPLEALLRLPRLLRRRAI